MNFSQLKIQRLTFPCLNFTGIVVCVLALKYVLKEYVIFFVLYPFVESLSKCPKHGLHNPLRAPERYVLFSCTMDVSRLTYFIAILFFWLPDVSDLMFQN